MNKYVLTILFSIIILCGIYAVVTLEASDFVEEGGGTTGLALGAECPDDSECISGKCNSYNTSATWDSATSKWVYSGITNGKCIEGKTGDMCVADYDCASKICVLHYYTKRSDNGKTISEYTLGVCDGSKLDNSTECALNEDCISNICINAWWDKGTFKLGVCATEKIKDGQKCEYYNNNCVSGECTSNFKDGSSIAGVCKADDAGETKKEGKALSGSDSDVGSGDLGIAAAKDNEYQLIVCTTHSAANPKCYNFTTDVKDRLEKGKVGSRSYAKGIVAKTLNSRSYKQQILDAIETNKGNLQKALTTIGSGNKAEDLIKALMMQESGFNNVKAKTKGECSCGIMQINIVAHKLDATNSCPSKGGEEATKCSGWSSWNDISANTKKGTELITSYINIVSTKKGCSQLKVSPIAGFSNVEGITLGEILGVMAYNSGPGAIKSCELNGATNTITVTTSTDKPYYASSVIAYKLNSAGKAPEANGATQVPDILTKVSSACLGCGSVLQCLACVDEKAYDQIFKLPVK
ncbi:MAG: hypothetical protein COT15_05000 [Candidatus Diapherotrites archaeon CG08_land_8_20_14_0_20_34_12]|nr:MAG: hypothetical protein COT15_05000 [Candidatus Diapherotrites archaeon CG08_land_8_20_14_0_20_34_12]